MITNKKTFLKQVKKDIPTFIDDIAIIDEAEEQLCFKDHVEFKYFDSNMFHNMKIKLYDFERFKNGNVRFLK